MLLVWAILRTHELVSFGNIKLTILTLFVAIISSHEGDYSLYLPLHPSTKCYVSYPNSLRKRKGLKLGYS